MVPICQYKDTPCHATDLEVPQMPAVFLLSLSRKLGSQKLHGSHRGNQSVNVVLREISTKARYSDMGICGSLDK